MLFIGNCVTCFDINGQCIENLLPWCDVTDFAQYIENYGDNFVIGNISVIYNANTDIHSFYLNK